MHQLIFRYGLPGLPISILLYIIAVYEEWLGNYSEVLGIPLIISISLLLGYFFQQLWMWFFELVPWLSYHSNKRRVLQELDKLINSKKKYKKYFKDKDLYSIWDSMLYSKLVDPGILNKDRNMWHSFHTNFGNAVGLILGIAFACVFRNSINEFFRNPEIHTIIVVSFSVTIFILVWKAMLTRRLANKLEIYWVNFYFPKYVDELLDT